MQHGSNFIVTAMKCNGGFYECLAWQPEEKITFSGQNPQIGVTFRQETCTEELSGGLLVASRGLSDKGCVLVASRVV